MSSESESPYLHSMTGHINGVPHTIEFDAREKLAEWAEVRGEVLTSKQLDEQADEFIYNLRRMQEAVQAPKREPSRLERAATKIGTALSSLIYR